MVLFLFSCSPIKYIPEGEYFLKGYKIDSENKEVLNFDIDNYVKQKPNKKVLGVYIYARVYNIIDPVKEAKREEERIPKEEAVNRERLAKGKDPKEKSHFTRWLRKIGEEPVLYSALQSRNSSKQIETLLHNKGFFTAEVTDSVKFAGKKASVSYHIQPGKPYKVKSFKDSINDNNIRKLVHDHFAQNPVKTDINLVGDNFAKLRNSIYQLLLNNGYYKFSKEYIFFEIDTLAGNHQANITMTIKDPVSVDPGGNTIELSHEQYKLDKFFIYPDYEPKDIIKKTKNTPITHDTIPVQENVYFLINKKNKYRKSVLLRGLVVKHGSLYEEEKIQSTFSYFGSLANFRLINIDFDENTNFTDTSENKLNKLDTHIKLTPSTPQSFTIEMEGNTTSGRYGMGTNLNYQHLNIFGGAEILNVQFKVELNNQDPGVGVEERENYFSETEYGVNTSIQFPNLISPFNTDNISRKYFPKTRFALGYNFRNNDNYKRTIFSTSYGYNWRSNELFTHELNPLEFNFIKLKDISPSHLKQLYETQQFKEKYDHVILGSSYSFTLNTQDIKKNRDFLYLKSTTEFAGNLLNLAHSIIKPDKLGSGDYQKEVLQIIADNDTTKTPEDAIEWVNFKVDSVNNADPAFYTISGLPYAQFLKTEIDFRYYNILNSKNELVYRINTGIIIPYGNSYYAPQEKQFFLGGASSMRAWQARTLGPGSYSDFVQIYQYGDIKLEMNIEYRFKLFWMLEGALFLDAGNIWSFKNDYNTDDKKNFKFNEFHKEIALGTGIGFRFDFSFFIIRFDFGLKLHDPAQVIGDRWLNISQFEDRDWTFNFGIGYPF
ncbi:MAG: BamA/TamA family outer membrane protein [Bacteroidota bacterium]